MERFMAAIGSRDWTELRAVCSDDFVLEMPYGDPLQRLEGLDAYLGYVEPALEVFRFELSIERVHDCLDPDQLIAEYTSEGIATPTGKPYRNGYIGVWRFRGGRLRSLREYFNPAVAAAALEPD
jgi:ketosteroid isomerase-like protein